MSLEIGTKLTSHTLISGSCPQVHAGTHITVSQKYTLPYLQHSSKKQWYLHVSVLVINQVLFCLLNQGMIYLYMYLQCAFPRKLDCTCTLEYARFT